jgi:uncharacterized membrane protein YhaH (DUF805 family)
MGTHEQKPERNFPMNWYLAVLKKFAEFSGRARRKEYWMFVLINLIISLVLTGLDYALNIGLLSGLYSLAILVPSLAVGVRRLHDINKSGWSLLISLIPLVGFIILILWLAKDSDAGDNTYGPNPKAA